MGFSALSTCEFYKVSSMVSQDPSFSVRKSFLCKVHNLLKNHALPNRYACSFAFACLDYLADIRTDVSFMFPTISTKIYFFLVVITCSCITELSYIYIYFW